MMKNVLEIPELYKSFDGTQAVRITPKKASVSEIPISIRRGEITALIGANGSGKTTLMNLIGGFLKADAGRILYYPKPHNSPLELTQFPAWKIARLGIGRLFQDIRVFEQMSVLDNVLLARKNNPGENPIANFFRFRRVACFEKQNLEQARYWLDFVGLSDKANSLAENLSYGQQKLLAIARLLASDSELLLLDEPTAGIHVDMIQNIINVLKRIVDTEGRTIFFVEHNVSVVNQIADWIYQMDRGEIVAEGSEANALQRETWKLSEAKSFDEPRFSAQISHAAC